MASARISYEVGEQVKQFVLSGPVQVAQWELQSVSKIDPYLGRSNLHYLGTNEISRMCHICWLKLGRC